MLNNKAAMQPWLKFGTVAWRQEIIEAGKTQVCLIEAQGKGKAP